MNLERMNITINQYSLAEWVELRIPVSGGGDHNIKMKKLGGGVASLADSTHLHHFRLRFRLSNEHDNNKHHSEASFLQLLHFEL